MSRSTLMVLTLGLALPGVASASEGGAGGGGLLTVSGGLMVWTLLVFALLLFILKRSAWPLILGAVEERERNLQAKLDEATRLNTEAKALLEQQQKLLADARGEAAAVLAEAKTAADRERAGAADKAKHEAEEILARARREIASERDRALADLRREAVDLALAAAGKLIGQRLQADQDKKIVTEYLASLEQGK
ncbi:MAG TPA: F0F1 ATP synthase subunit B [Gemmatimonadales bacterium]|jgi:F-type H+-transporting ATPase subunit b|nr:F0F1 ATP synthase subunit B [Gemmatimonadales bacterium]